MNQITKASFWIFGICSLFVSAESVFAQDAPSGTIGGIEIPTEAETGLSEKGFDYVLIAVIKWLLGIVAALAIVAIIAAGIRIMTAGGGDGVETGKKMLWYAVLGLVIALLGWSIVSAISIALGAGI